MLKAQAKKTIMIFGVGELQKSMIKRAKNMGLFVVGIDPCVDAFCRDDVDAFEVVGGQDYDGTLEVAKKYNISAIITAATDKPLVMMARVAKELELPFYSVETAEISTDKFRMKECFEQNYIPCAHGKLVSTIEETEDLQYPLIVKPRDNSGSRGVIYCKSKSELELAFNEAKQYTKLPTLLVEEYLEGREFSIEGIHYADGSCDVIQFTEKKTTPLPYNVELGHIQPANITEEQKNEIRNIIAKISKSFGFCNCASHTELKINSRGIFVIETSPRLGGGYITSNLVPLSTGINIESVSLRLALNEIKNLKEIKETCQKNFAAVVFLNFQPGIIINNSKEVISFLNKEKEIKAYEFSLKDGDVIRSLKTGLDRYGMFIICAETREELEKKIVYYNDIMNELILK